MLCHCATFSADPQCFVIRGTGCFPMVALLPATAFVFFSLVWLFRRFRPLPSFQPWRLTRPRPVRGRTVVASVKSLVQKLSESFPDVAPTRLYTAFIGCEDCLFREISL